MYARMEDLQTNTVDLQQALADLAALTASVGSGFSRDLTAVLKFTLAIVGGKFVVYNLFDLDKGVICTQRGYNLPVNFRTQGRLPGRICYEAFWVEGKHQAVYFDLGQTHFVTSDPDIQQHHLRAYAGAPLRMGGDVVGSLAVYDDQPRRFSVAQRSMLQIIAQLVAYIAQQKAHEMRFQRLKDNEKMLSELSAKAISTQDDSFLDICLQAMGEASRLDAAAILWYDPDNGEVIPYLHCWDQKCIVPTERQRYADLLSAPMIGDAIRNKQPFFCDRIEKVADEATRIFLLKNSVSSFLLLPICNEQKVYGIFYMSVTNGSGNWEDEGLAALMSNMRIIAQWKERRVITQQLDESQALINQLFQLAPTTIYQIDLRAGRLTKVNDQMCRHTGYSEEELLSMKPEELLTPESIEVFYEKLANIDAGGPLPRTMELQVKTKSGKLEWGLLHINHLYADDKIWGANVVAHVITEQKRANEELAKYRRQLEALVEERTRELSLANQKLREEVAHRTETAKELRLKSDRLKELNTAMRVLLDKRDEDRLRSEENIRVNLVQLIEPYLDRLDNSGLNGEQQQLLNVIRMNLDDVIGSPMPELSAKYYIFSPAELQVANLIRNGRTTKDMARILNISPRTVESYRNSIRKKLGLKNKKVNLKTYLSAKE